MTRQPLPKHVRTLVQSCFTITAVWEALEDFHLEPVTDFLPEGALQIIENELRDGYTVYMYTLPRKRGRENYLFPVSSKDGHWYKLDLGYPKYTNSACTARMLEIAIQRKEPWSYRSRDGRIALLLAGLCFMLATTIAVIIGLNGELTDRIWLVVAMATITCTLGATILYLPKYYWEARKRRVEDALALMLRPE